MVMRKQLSHYLRGAHESGVLIRDLMTVRDTATLKARIAALLPE